MDVPRLDPSVLSERVVNPIFIIAIAGSIAPHVGAKLERIVTILSGRNKFKT